ncbi:Selenophosphate-dependent tRNA 2-selenouridine synthase [hydrothermal vent metagenome]|uniref:Selenophosphate-dependent tRNA 2-selenouridine synthase n=1 Tax=hydrothermal vent metagenome TaxID=652676 RepID=A0A3B0YJ80_9ZZZZ
MSTETVEFTEIDNYFDLFTADTPLIDVRAPVEFSQGAFPLASNLPLMSDEDRHLIGICYKNHGQQRAIELGKQLVSGDIKSDRINSWAKFTTTHPQGALYCFRGGLRSKITQQWIYEKTNIIYPRIKGGYKALRQFLLEQLTVCAEAITPVIIGGRTGVGKTLLLYQLQKQIDLEKILGHRGSAFGKHVYPQPGQIDVENTLAISLLKFFNAKIKNIALEDEAANIGSRQIPKALFMRMQQSPLILLEASIEERVNNVFNEYVTQALNEYCTALGIIEGTNAWIHNLNNALDKIKRRLGGVRFKALQAQVEQAIKQQQLHRDNSHHKLWIETLLVDYYDPMYDYQISKKEQRIVFRGKQQTVLTLLNAQYNIQ